MTKTEGEVTTADGVRLFFEQRQPAEPLNRTRPVLIPNGLYLLEDFERLALDRPVIAFDLRNRGRSDRVTEASKLEHGIHHDVEDLEAVRRQFGVERADVIGHSYVGVTAILYAMKYPTRVNRVVQIGAMPPDQNKQYPPHLMNADEVLRNAMAGIARLHDERQQLNPQEFCERFWSLLRPIYVANAADASKIRWSRCDLENERNFMRYWLEYVFPSIKKLRLTPDELQRVEAPVLVVHGTMDRGSPYGGGRDWASILPEARLLTVEHAAHAPWIEAPELVLGAIRMFLDGRWPDGVS
jgi:proline iminopeptidase